MNFYPNLHLASSARQERGLFCSTPLLKRLIGLSTSSSGSTRGGKKGRNCMQICIASTNRTKKPSLPPNPESPPPSPGLCLPRNRVLFAVFDTVWWSFRRSSEGVGSSACDLTRASAFAPTGRRSTRLRSASVWWSFPCCRADFYHKTGLLKSQSSKLRQ